MKWFYLVMGILSVLFIFKAETEITNAVFTILFAIFSSTFGIMYAIEKSHKKEEKAE